MKDRRWLKHELVDVRHVIEAAIVILGTWLILGWSFDRAITQVDGSVLVVPYMQSVLQAGASWSDHLYRFGVIGGSKMHEFGGTMPIVELCALLGLSVTMTVNVLTLFVQLCFGVLGLKMVQSLVNTWSATPRPLDAFERITVLWATSFSPLIAWRLAFGHENLLFGLLPFLAALTLLVAARAR